MDEKDIERINELARKKKAAGLTPEEAEEQARLYQEFLANIRTQVINALDEAGFKPKGEKSS